MKILIAEDDLASRTLLEGVLTKWGYTVVSTADGTDAWNKLQGPDAPRLALLDWMMPGMSVPDLCRRLREDQKGSECVYLILLTARSAARDIARGLDAGADDYIAKPYDNEELRARLNLARRILDLQAASAQKDDLLSAFQTARTLCHDINQPLQAASGYAELLAMTLPEDAPQRPTLTRIVDSVERIGGLVEKMMHLARRHTQS